jgi:two-component system, NtrC family, sensor histidine kinase AtoS
LVLMLLEPAESLVGDPEQQGKSPFWKGLNELVGAEMQDDLQTALTQALAAASRLCGADVLGIYQLMEGRPEIHRLARHGSDGLLPEILGLQDLVVLNELRLWEAGRQPTCSLHRAARATGLRYLASAPVGPGNALVGLVLIASTQSEPPDMALQIAHLLANVTESIFQNQTFRTNLNSELKKQTLLAHRLATISERVQEGILRVSPELRIRSMNPRMEQFLGYSSREVTGQEVENILIANESLLPTLKQAQTGEAVFNLGDMRLYRRDGESFQALIRVFPIFYGDGVDEILIFIQDLSELEQFRLQAQTLENRALMGELMAIFAHEVRNPINNISAGLQLMKMSVPSGDPKQDSISRMLQDCDRLEELIKQVLAFSKPMEYEMDSLDLGQIIQRLVDRQRMRISGQNIHWELQIEPGELRVMGNMRALEQVFTNLITNAVQAMGEAGGLLSLKVQPVLDSDNALYMEVCVADTGPGIPKEIQGKIFQPFYTTKRSGNGLGLSVSKRIITAHHGTIHLTSFPGGTIFRVRLPAIQIDART